LKRLIRKLFSNYKYKSLKKDLSRFDYPHRQIAYADAHDVAIVFEGKGLDELNDLLNVILELKSDNKKVYTLVYLDVETQKEFENIRSKYTSIKFIYNKDLKLNGKPGGKYTEHVMKEKHDLVINLSGSESFTTSYIVGLSKSTFRVGKFFDRTSIAYDFMLHSENKRPSDIFKQLKHYLLLFKS
jgi:hypothetical protein